MRPHISYNSFHAKRYLVAHTFILFDEKRAIKIFEMWMSVLMITHVIGISVFPKGTRVVCITRLIEQSRYNSYVFHVYVLYATLRTISRLINCGDCTQNIGRSKYLVLSDGLGEHADSTFLLYKLLAEFIYCSKQFKQRRKSWNYFIISRQSWGSPSDAHHTRDLLREC